MAQPELVAAQRQGPENPFRQIHEEPGAIQPAEWGKHNLLSLGHLQFDHTCPCMLLTKLTF